jgi:phosphatidylserine/phosphatidylglycerophosphate/cardiolipin synthase-like enzyme
LSKSSPNDRPEFGQGAFLRRVTRPARNTKLRMRRCAYMGAEVCLISSRCAKPGSAYGAILIARGLRGLPQHVKKYPSDALAKPQNTSLARDRAEQRGRQQQEPVGHPIAGISGEEALDSLIALADHAERTLDIQYYIIHQDDSARLLLHHVREAADRGVRVRVLVDDLNTAGEDRRFLHLGHHANIEVRVFNPFPGGRSATWSRFVASIRHSAHQSSDAQQAVRRRQRAGHHRRAQHRR